jgi:hypothetical protein
MALMPHKKRPPNLISGYNVLLELVEESKSFKQAKKQGKLLCKRIGTVLPYLEKLADFMYESEEKSRLRTEVNLFLYDEKTEYDRFGHTWVRGPLHKHDPLSGYYLLLSFGDMRGQKSVELGTDKKRRYLIISLFDEPYAVPIGHVYVNMKNYEVGT